MNRISVAAPDLSGNEERYVVDALRSTWISSTGPYVDRFEKEFAELCDTSSSLTVSNGTVALHLALLALGVGPGDEVIVPSLTYIATANAVRYVGAEPVFVDVEEETWCIDPSLIEAAITPRTKGVIVVHLYGHPADMDPINEVAAAHGVWVVEDAAEAHFATYKGRPVGGLSTMGTFSFYGNKMITSGEGGAITLNDSELYNQIRMLRGQGMDPERRYYFPIVGYNYRLTNIASALLCAQLERRHQIAARRQEVFDDYTEMLSDIPGITLQPVAPWAEPAPWLYCITVDENEFGLTSEHLTAGLDQRGIETRPFFVPIHSLPPYREESQCRREFLPITDRLARSGLNLPTHAGITRADVEYIASSISELRGGRLLGSRDRADQSRGRKAA